MGEGRAPRAVICPLGSGQSVTTRLNLLHTLAHLGRANQSSEEQIVLGAWVDLLTKAGL